MKKQKESVIFSLMDAGLKKSGAVEVYDERTLDSNGNIIPFATQLAIVSHYCMLRNTTFANAYSKATDLVECWTNTSHPKLDSNLAAEPSAFHYSLFEDFYAVPFQAKDKTSFSFIDLFAGIGGFRIAAQNIGGQCVFSSEWDVHAQKTYFANYGEVPFGDITSSLTKGYIPNKFDVLCAGFPCQPFSYAGEKKGFEDKIRGTLFFDICQILKDHIPPMVFLENVKGLVSHNKGETLSTILSSLRSLGYYPP